MKNAKWMTIPEKGDREQKGICNLFIEYWYSNRQALLKENDNG